MLVCPFDHMRTQGAGVIQGPENGPSSDTRSAGALILDFLASGTERNKCLLWKPPGILLQEPTLAETHAVYTGENIKNIYFLSCTHIRH